MTHPTDEELDALVQMLQQRNKSKHGYTGHPLYNRDGLQAADAITALRAQLAAANARADRAEAALAAQIQADAGLMERRADDLSDAVKWGGSKQYITSLKGGEVELRNAAKLIRAQPHDRTALDRMLADAEAKALRRAADMAMQKTYRTHAPKDFRDGYDVAKADAATAILNMIPKEGEA